MEIADITRFLMQLGLVLAGSSALWAWVLLFKAEKSSYKKTYQEIAFSLLPIFFLGSLLFLALWPINYFVFFADSSLAHEGIIKTPNSYIINGFAINAFFVPLMAVLLFWGKWAHFKKKELFLEKAKNYFALQFLLLSAIISLSAFVGRFGAEQIGQSLHNWHSFLTLGTVVCVDFLYLITTKRDNLKGVLYRFYPIMSLAIWFGLGLDFLSTHLTFGGGFPTDSQFYFNQIVVAIIVLNGAVLSIKLNEYLIGLIKKDKVEKPSGKMAHIMHVSGSVSIVSWFTITFLDFVSFNWNLALFALVYLALIIFAYFSKIYVDKIFT